MTRLGIILVIAVVAFTIYAFIDALITDRMRVRGLPRGVWAIIVLVLFPPLGGILWLVLGKERASRGLGRSPRAPDDDPEFLQRLGEDKARDARIQELEARLAELDDDHDDPKK